MKHFFIFALVVFAFYSCTKKTHCYQCTTVDNNGHTSPTVTHTSHCGWSEDDKQNYIQSKSKVWINGGATAVTKVTCNIEK